jgi:paraquat-inducible protein B
VSQKVSPTLIGAFVLGSVVLVVIGLMVFGGGRFFTERVSYVAYFEESVSGLNEGAPVNFRGVKVGSVSHIEVQLDAQDLSVRIPVYIQLERRRIREVRGAVPEGGVIPDLIERGLRAQLQLQSLVTGQLYVQLDLHPDRKARYVRPDGPDPEMPTIRSSMAEITETIESLSIQELVTAAQQALGGINALVNSPDVAQILSGINQLVNSPEILQLVTDADIAIGELRAFIRNTDGHVDDLDENLEKTLEEANKTLQGIQETLIVAQETLSIGADESPMRYELEQVLSELASAARSIRVLAEYLEHNPDALLRGKPGGPR